MPSVGIKIRNMTMKKEYITPVINVVEINVEGMLLSGSTTVDPNEPVIPRGSNEYRDYEDSSRPGSGNVWDQGW